ncbi:hypothetical protein D6_0071 [Aeromonas phage D6]|uniref:Uncharacterized protein n=1 Tax=Aeromonas phage D6 TaxID=2593322 RepID=A0A514TW24_9CAUD|nr:hypothetical protein PQC08_gp204 [Aeromonas phage D6]QDJ97231.1 hypothetical protein D6_0071 [Aeromonas phage D6]
MSDQEKPIDVLRAAVLLGKPDTVGFGIPIFTGGLKEQHRVILEAAQLFYAIRELESEMEKNGRTDQTTLNSLRVRYTEHTEEHFQGVSEKQLAEMLVNYFTFYRRTLDRIQMRDDVTAERQHKPNANVVTTQRGPIGIINSIKPGKLGNLSMKDRMRKNFAKSSGSVDGFSIMLMNSRVFLKIKLPTPMDLLLLMNKIANKLSGFGKRVRASSLELERALIVREVVEFVIEMATYWSVSDILDARELLNVIKESDANHLAVAILAASAPKGLNYRMSCLAHKCNFSDDVLIDAANMVHFDNERYPAKYMEQVQMILNTGHKFSIQELHDSDVPFIDTDGTEIETRFTMNDGSVSIELKEPYLADYFECFDNAAARINPQLRQLAVQFSEPERYKREYQSYMGSIRTNNYTQWVDKIIFHVAAGEEGEDEVMSRGDNPKEFDEGLIDCLGSQEELAGILLERVIKVIPRLSYTSVGILSTECPQCKQTTDEEVTKVHGGYTPIDPFLTFFDHTQMLIELRRELAITQEELLS